MTYFECRQYNKNTSQICKNCNHPYKRLCSYEEPYTKICRYFCKKRWRIFVRFILFLKRHGIVGFVFKTIIIGTVTAIIGGFLANLWIDNYNKNVRIQQQEEMLDTLAIGISKEYVSSILGIPIISHTDENGMSNCYYVMNGIKIRIIYSENVLNAYFITIADKDRTYELNNRNYDFVLGEDTYAEFPESVTGIESKIEGSGDIHFYGEVRSTGRRNVFNSPVLATLQYGTDFEENPGSLIEKAYTTIMDYYGYDYMDSVDFYIENHEGVEDILEIINKERNSIRPNTFGEIGGQYASDIRILDRYPGWINIPQILR